MDAESAGAGEILPRISSTPDSGGRSAWGRPQAPKPRTVRQPGPGQTLAIWCRERKSHPPRSPMTAGCDISTDKDMHADTMHSTPGQHLEAGAALMA